MINDLESNIISSENIEHSSDNFIIKSLNLQNTFQNLNILCMSVSKKYIYLFTDHADLLCIESNTLQPIRQAYSISASESSGISRFKENYTKIWTDRAGNHTIIRFSGKIYYFNINGNDIKELNNFRGKEICAVGFDNYGDDPNNTGIFLATDYYNNIYECSIQVEKKSAHGDYIIKDTIEKISKLNFKDWDTEEDDEEQFDKRIKDERIYGIKFIRTSKKENNIQFSDKCYYIIAVTKTRLYQITGTGYSGFKQTFGRFNDSPMLFNESCKYFPYAIRKKNFNGTDIDLLFKDDKLEQFGWKTESGFCFGSFKSYVNLPEELKDFTVIPFAKITSDGNKEVDLEPIQVAHTRNHVFVLYNDCLTIISKLTSNIVNTLFFQSEYKGLVYNEYSNDGGNILLFSKNGLYQISLKDENKDIWQDYLDIGEYANAINCCKNDNKLVRRINRINAEELFNRGDYLNSAMIYNNSDENFEIICLKYLMKDQIDALNYFLELYLSTNYSIKKEKGKEKEKEKENEKSVQANLISTLLVEILLNKSDKKSSVEEFRQLIRDKNKYLQKGNIIYHLLQSYGKMEEFADFAAIMGDYESVILYYINEGEVDTALDNLKQFASYMNDKDTLKILSDIFKNNCHIFFKKNPKESISLIQQRFNNIEMNSIVQAIISTTDKDADIISHELKNISKSSNLQMSKKEDNANAILSYLKSLVKNPKIDEINNIHNLYIYYLSKNKANQEAIKEYLKAFLKSEKKEVPFQLDYAKKLFKDNIPAYSLVLALMGKYSEGVKNALNAKTPECQKIARFIASNAPGEKLRKKLWIDIFSCDSQNEFNEALKIMKESKILKIEDVLPHITDTIKIEEFKKQISNCINDYEQNIKKLKDDINEYNKTAENIKNDIVKVKKKSMEINYSSCKCDICQGYIKDKNIFLFPCGHMFDANCIKKCLLDYEATGLEYLHENNVQIDKLFFELKMSNQKSFFSINPDKMKEKEIDEKKQQEEQSKASGFFNILKKNLDPVFKKQEVTEEKGVKNRQQLITLLNEKLSQQCVLCGDYMVDSIQCSICRPEKMEVGSDGFQIKTNNQTSWEYIE